MNNTLPRFYTKLHHIETYVQNNFIICWDSIGEALLLLLMVPAISFYIELFWQKWCSPESPITMKEQLRKANKQPFSHASLVFSSVNSESTCSLNLMTEEGENAGIFLWQVKSTTAYSWENSLIYD